MKIIWVNYLAQQSIPNYPITKPIQANTPKTFISTSEQPIANIKDSNNKEKNTDWDISAAFYAQHITASKHSKSKDLSKDFPPSHKQNNNTYSCVGFATTDMVYWYLNKLGYKVEKLSARFNWIAAKETDKLNKQPTTFIAQAGTTLKASLDVCRNYGSVDDILLPTETDADADKEKNRLFQGTTEQFYAQAAIYKIQAYFSLILPHMNTIGTTMVEEKKRRKIQVFIWKKWIDNNGPILVRINVDKEFYEAKKAPLINHVLSEAYQKHAALLIGYNEKNFILRNSWGADWGDKGNDKLSEDYALDAIDEAYGITMPHSNISANGVGAAGGFESRSLIDKILDLLS